MQDEKDAKIAKHSGFSDIRVLKENTFENTSITRIQGRHGVIKPAGNSMGVVFQNPLEPTVYLASDTVFEENTQEALRKYQPDVVIVNACAAYALGFGRLIMNDEDIMQIHQILPDAKIITVHMDTVSHAMLMRKQLRRKIYGFGLVNTVLIPEDGDTMTFYKKGRLLS